MGHSFDGWSGGCSGTSACTITLEPITSINATFSAIPYSISDTASGLSGTVVLQNNGADDLAVSSNGGFTLQGSMETGQSYAVTIASQPATQACTLDNASGTVVDQDITDVVLSCETIIHTVNPIAGPGGAISPSTPQQVSTGDTIAFTLTPEDGFVIDAVQGCDGNLAANTYTTGPITADCTAQASFKPGTSLSATASVDPVGVPQPVIFTVEVTAPSGSGAPPDGTVRVEADTGEFCQSTTPAQVQDDTATHACSIAFDSLGPRALTITFFGSPPTHADSAPTLLSLMVGSLADLSVAISTPTPEAFPGEVMVHEVVVANAGPPRAQQAHLVVLQDPSPAAISWTSQSPPGSAASCPAASGTGDIALLLDLPSGSSLVFTMQSTLPGDLSAEAMVIALAATDPEAPDFVVDPDLSNNEVVFSRQEGIFRDGFDQD